MLKEGAAHICSLIGSKFILLIPNSLYLYQIANIIFIGNTRFLIFHLLKHVQSSVKLNPVFSVRNLWTLLIFPTWNHNHLHIKLYLQFYIVWLPFMWRNRQTQTQGIAPLFLLEVDTSVTSWGWLATEKAMVRTRKLTKENHIVGIFFEQIWQIT